MALRRYICRGLAQANSLDALRTAHAVSVMRPTPTPVFHICTSSCQHSLEGAWSRLFSNGSSEKQAEASSDKAEEGQPKADGTGNDAETAGGETLSAEQLLEEIKMKEQAVGELTHQVEKLTDSLKRSLAEMENLRTRTAREVDQAKKFAVQGFVKSLLDVPDNLERAAGAIPAESLTDDMVDTEKLKGQLKGLLQGVKMTESVMLQALKGQGVEQFNPVGEKFDPNMHSALFELPDPSKEAGTVAVVTKRGYKLHDRVIRPAEVGVVKSQ